MSPKMVERIREAIAYSGKSDEQLRIETGISKSRYNEIISTGHYDITSRTLKAICRATNCSSDYILGLSNKMEREL